jgi:O-antigen/teichoic acid export membrane protein
VSVVGSAVGVPTSFLVARWLGPGEFGLAQTVLLAYSYAALLRSGIFEAGTRAYIHHATRGETAQARKAQNVAVSFETAVSLVPGLALLGAAFLFNDTTQRVGFALGPIAVVAASVNSYFSALYGARERFDVVATGNLTRALVAPALTLAGVPLIGASALFVAPTVADVVTVVYLATRTPGLGIRIDFDFASARPLFRVGFALGALPVVYWVYRLIGSTSVAIGTTARTYGVYAFAAAPVAILARAISGIHAVLIPALWGELATDSEDVRWLTEANRVTIGLALLAGAVTSLSQAVFRPIVHVFLPQFQGSVSLFDVLSYNILLLSIAAVPSLVLTSTRHNKQARYLAVWVGALVVNTAANIAVLAGGLGVLAVAANDVWIQAVVVVAIFALAWRYLGGTRGQGATTSVTVALVVLAVTIGLVLHFLPIDSSFSSVWVVELALRTVGAALVWVAAAALLRKRLTDHHR